MDTSINHEKEQGEQGEQEYVNSLTDVEKKAFYVAKTNITNIFRMEHIVGYKDFISRRPSTKS